MCHFLLQFYEYIFQNQPCLTPMVPAVIIAFNYFQLHWAVAPGLLRTPPTSSQRPLLCPASAASPSASAAPISAW
jgi:hypothetical protein